MLNEYKTIPSKTLKKIIYNSHYINTPLRSNQPVLYADYIASGKPSPLIEEDIIKQIYCKYSNTHSNATLGITMKQKIEDVKDLIKKKYNVNDTYEILFKGSGATACINYLVDCMDYKKYNKVYIFISMYEHFSNHLPWLELSKHNPHIELFIIPLHDNNELNLKWYNAQMDNIYNSVENNTKIDSGCKRKTLIITTVTHCSNVTGYFLPVKKISSLIRRHKHPDICSYFFTDMAASAPYVGNVDGKLFDAIFMSGHKFIGGVETPGLMICKTHLFHKKYSANPGGSCVKTTNFNKIEYAKDIETRESAGTPNIIGIIKLGKCLLLKQQFQNIIDNNENFLNQAVNEFSELIKEKYPDRFFYVKYNNNTVAQKHKLPILSFYVKGMHYNYIVVLLNDIFGIQSRGGKLCAGLFFDWVQHKYGCDGFCRISLHWIMSTRDVEILFKAVDFIIEHGEQFKHLYQYNEETNLFTYCDGVGGNKQN